MFRSGNSKSRNGPADGGPLFLRGLAALVAATALTALAAALPAAAGADRPGILVRFEPGATPAERTGALAAVDGDVVRSFGLVPGLRLVEIPGGSSKMEAREALSDMPAVEFTSADAYMEIDRDPDDPLLGGQWGIAAIRAPSAWDLTTGSSDVAVAVIDTGTDLDHPDLAGNLWTNPDEIRNNGIDDDGNGFVDDVHGWDFVNRDANPDDDQSHGTHTAGTVGAIGNNGIGVSGVAWDVSLVPLKICSATGRCLVSDAIAALEYAVREGIPISNNSYGYIGSCPTAFGEAIQAAGEAGHLVVASAGNEGRDLGESPKYPAACPQENVISVAWLADERTLASKSNYGKPEVDLAAPGEQIQSTIPGGGYGTKSGTSMAGPHVAGTAALLKSAEPGWGWEEIRDRIMSSTREVCGLAVVTSGTLDAGAALTGDATPERICPEAPVVSTGPPALTNSQTATFTFTGADEASYECRLDSGPWEACSSPKTYTGVMSGSRVFRVTQRIGDGPVSAASSWSWTVDTKAPMAPMVSTAPVSPTILRTATFTITGESGATFECLLDDGPAEACSSPLNLSGLSTGTHSLTVSQIDKAGNRSPGTVRTWTITAEVPARPVIQSGPGPLVALDSVSIAFTGDPGTTALCRLDRNGTPGIWSGCESPVVLPALTDGSYLFSVIAVNGSGVESTPAQLVWTVDRTAPAAPLIQGGPEGYSPTADAVFAFSGEDSASVECRLEHGTDSSGWVTCPQDGRWEDLPDGPKRLRARLRDPAGNVSFESVREWTVDTTAPDPPILSGGPEPISASRSASLSITTEPGGVASCRLDGGDSTPCDGRFEVQGLADGAHLLRVIQTDPAGNESSDATWLWVVDTVAPDAPSIASGPSGLSTNSEARFALVTEAGARIECRLGSGPWEACPSPIRFDSLPDGPMSASFRQIDRAGNLSPATERSWITDATAPEVAAARRLVDRRGRISLSVRAIDRGSGLAGLDISFSASRPSGRADRQMRWSGRGSVAVGDSMTPFWVRVSDRAGNSSDWVRLKPR